MRCLEPIELVLVELQGARASPKQDEGVPVEFHRPSSYQAMGM
jgi:hypothetical protein